MTNPDAKKTSLKSVNLKAIKHNLRHALKKAAFDNDLEAVAEAAQAIYEAGYELEDMEFTPGFFDAIASQIIKSGWVPETIDADNVCEECGEDPCECCPEHGAECPEDCEITGGKEFW